MQNSSWFTGVPPYYDETATDDETFNRILKVRSGAPPERYSCCICDAAKRGLSAMNDGFCIKNE